MLLWGVAVVSAGVGDAGPGAGAAACACRRLLPCPWYCIVCAKPTVTAPTPQRTEGPRMMSKSSQIDMCDAFFRWRNVNGTRW